MSSTMDNEMVYDVIVIGAGIEGSATAYHLAKNNKRTLLLEQFPLPHTRGSSHGQSRIIRKAYRQKYYAEMMEESYKLWHELEKETATKLFFKTGMLVVSSPESDYVKENEKALMGIGAVFQKLTGEEINKQFPMLRFPPDFSGLYDYEAGVLMADKCLLALQKMFVQYGGCLQDGEGVTSIIPGDTVTVDTSKSKTYKSKSLVIAAGPWTNKLTTPLGLTLPLEPYRTGVFYWKQHDSSVGYGIEDNYPCVIVDGAITTANKTRLPVYSIPALEYPLHVKLCGNSMIVTDPDNRDAAVDLEEDVRLQDFVSMYYPGLDPVPSIKEVGIVTRTPDRDFILDHHPKHDNVIIAAGFSGHGFKMAPVVGRILSEMALKIPVKDNVSNFCIIRF